MYTGSCVRPPECAGSRFRSLAYRVVEKRLRDLVWRLWFDANTEDTEVDRTFTNLNIVRNYQGFRSSQNESPADFKQKGLLSLQWPVTG